VLVYLCVLLVLNSSSSSTSVRSAPREKMQNGTSKSKLTERWDVISFPPEADVDLSVSTYLQALDILFRRLSSSEHFIGTLWEKLPERWNASETWIPDPNFDFRNLSEAAKAGALKSSGDTYFTEDSPITGGPTFFTINETQARSGMMLTPADLERHFENGATLSINKAGMIWPWIGVTTRPASSHTPPQ
jgi:hypothetical protein